ncbi:Por secretion system C-terminal sorting domain-containing protein [Nonlabens sp. Hel1_33_55]|uniref:T9SS type A sorting domain-containing protein n=1 Tax=Nonlabens sp. Hel1_33_55 TaxID=1336802 RepID=UPI000875E7BE|nr:T9SS type A sorting domain-containing protein [Nonlabens sp. Hel1_33_55]SCX94726.1 Por secretion system C-terminal sorting domain-containing protein [Nonlabens sp. Hel1_33_55]
MKHFLLKRFWFFFFFACSIGLAQQNAWINEIHYDNAGGDINEGIEVIVENSGAASDYLITAYNGSNGTSYDTEDLSAATATDLGNGFTLYNLLISGIQNGGPDGIALSYQGLLIPGQFLSYEGSFTATNGVADGNTSTDIGVSETSSTPTGQSLQLSGSGNNYFSFGWQDPASDTFGALNNGQTIAAGVATTQVNFAATAVAVNEGVGTTSVEVIITNEDATNETNVDVVLTSGDAADVNNFSTQSLTFSAGSSMNQTVTFTITDDAVVEGNDILVFSLQNVTGGNDAGVGSLNTFTLTIEDNDFPPAPTLIFTEIADPSDVSSGRFVEIYNNGSEIIDFSATPIYISRFVNGATAATSGDTESLTTGSIAPGEFFVIASSGVNFKSQYGFTTNEINGGFAVDGNDPFGMYTGTFPNGVLFDVYGEIGTFGNGEAWQYNDSQAVRNDLSVMPSTIWNASEWDITTANIADMTPATGESGISYTYSDDLWSPRSPEGNATINDLVVVVEGTAAITGDVNAFHIKVEDGATLDLGINILNVNTLITNNGTLVADQGTLNFAGIVPSTVKGKAFALENLIVNNVSGLSINNPLALEGMLTLTNGELSTNNNLTFKSELNKSAVVDEVISGSISGNVTIEQFFPATTGRKFRFVSAPLNFEGSIFENWQEVGASVAGLGVQITGGTIADGYDQSATNNPSLFRFDNDYTVAADAWTAVSSENGDDLTMISPVAGDSFRLFVRGDRTTDLFSNTPAATATTLRATGTLVAGAYPATPITLAGPNLYSLIGNPYQSKVNVQQLLQAATNVVASEYYQWDPTINNYVLYEFATPNVPMGSEVTEEALPGQSFFVQSDATGNGTLQFQESFKISGSEVPTKSLESLNQLTINLSTQEQAANGKANDIAIARFDEQFSSDFNEIDTKKFFGLSHSIAWENDGEHYIVNRANTPQDGDRFILNVFVSKTDTYTFTIQNSSINGIDAYFYDSLNDTYDLLNDDDNTAITKFIDLNDIESATVDRFNIVFSKSTLGINDSSAFAKAISIYPNPSTGNDVTITNLVQGESLSIEVYNSLGQEMLKVEKVISGPNETLKDLDNFANGLYLVKVSQNDLQTTVKLMIN